jgi:hypothetical protein
VRIKPGDRHGKVLLVLLLMLRAVWGVWGVALVGVVVLAVLGVLVVVLVGVGSLVTALIALMVALTLPGVLLLCLWRLLLGGLGLLGRVGVGLVGCWCALPTFLASAPALLC